MLFGELGNSSFSRRTAKTLSTLPRCADWPESSLGALEKTGVFVCLCWGLTSQSTIFQSCRDGATASWVINQYFRGVKCLAQGHNTAAVGIEPPTSRSGVRHSTTEPPRSPKKLGCGVVGRCLPALIKKKKITSNTKRATSYRNHILVTFFSAKSDPEFQSFFFFFFLIFTPP